MKDELYHIPKLNTMIIARQEEKRLMLTGVFSLQECCFSELAQHLPFQNVETVEFGFMPYWDDLSYSMQETETDPLFVRGVNCELGDFKFPELALT